jgi:hypothetical protein
MPSNHDPFVVHDPKKFLARERKGIDKDTAPLFLYMIFVTSSST